MWKLCRGQLCRAGCLRSGATSPPQSKTTRPVLEALAPPKLKPNSTSRRSFVLHSLKIPVCHTQQPSLLKAGTYCRRASDVFRQRHYFTSPSSFKAPLYPQPAELPGGLLWIMTERWVCLTTQRAEEICECRLARGRLPIYLLCCICASRWQISYFCGRLQCPFFPVLLPIDGAGGELWAGSFGVPPS